MMANPRKVSLSHLDHLAHNCSFLLQGCIKAKALKQCKKIHALMLINHVDTSFLSLSSRLIGAYSCCGDLRSSKLLFQQTPNPNAFAFNCIIVALTSSGFHKDAIGYFSLLQKSRDETISPNMHTFSAILKCCLGLSDAYLGEQVHGMVHKLGFDMDVSVCNVLIDMYGKCGRIYSARKLFVRMSQRDVVSWTTIICRYTDIGCIKEAISFFDRMSLEGVKPNEFTWNAIITGFARSGDCNGAYKYFLQMCKGGQVPDLATWNAMISGFSKSQQSIEALKLFLDMLNTGVKPNHVTITSLLPVCAKIGSVERGKEIHGLIYCMGININVFVASALIDMYSKTGSLEEALHVFNMAHSKNAASWNAMISCYGNHGMVDRAIKLFERMQDEGIKPNEVTFVSVLCACSHCGLVDEGLEIFGCMDLYGVKANKEHYACVVDLLCRFGRLDEAFDIIKQIVNEVTESMIGCFLNGCKVYRRHDLGGSIFKLLEKEMKEPGGYVTLANIYASEGMWQGVQGVRMEMKDKRIQKKYGFSSV